jgi:hypothetical protein
VARSEREENLMACRYCCPALAFTLALFLLGCQAVPQQSADTRLRIACEQFAEALWVLSVQNTAGQLSGRMQDRVTAARDLVRPICNGTRYGVPSDLLRTVQFHLEVMLLEQADG